MSFSKSKQTGLKFIGGAVIIALASGVGAYYTISKITAKVAILVAKAPVAKGDPLTKELFNIAYLPKGGVPEDALTPATILTTRISNKDMAPDDILRSVNTTDLKRDNPSLLSARLRAIEEQTVLVGGEIPIESIQGMLDGMKSGDRVYVVGVTKEAIPGPTSNASNTKVVGKTVVESAIAVGIRGATDGKPALIIAMSKEDAIKVAIAREEGKIYVYLLPFGKAINAISQSMTTEPVSNSTIKK